MQDDQLSLFPVESQVHYLPIVQEYRQLLETQLLQFQIVQAHHPSLEI